MSARSMTGLRKLPAPAYWSRWAVDDLGVVEKRGGFALWTVLGLDGRLVATRCRNRAEAVACLRGAR